MSLVNKLTPEAIESVIVSTSYTRLGESTATVCQLTLKNGFVVEGISHCADPANFNQEEGEKWARKQAFEKIWDLEGYLLKERLFQKEALRGKIFEISPNRVSQWPSMEDLGNLQLQMAAVDDPEELREALAVLIKGITNYYSFAGDRMVDLQRHSMSLSSENDHLRKVANKPSNFRLTSEINEIVGNHPTGDVQAWRRQAGLIRDEVVELLGNLHMDALFKFDMVKIAEALVRCEGYDATTGDSLSDAMDVANEFLKLHKYQAELFTPDSLPGVSINPYAIRDDIQDILVTAYGLSHRMGFDADEDHMEVYRSNMTKFDTNEMDASKTQAKYEKLGVKTVVVKSLVHSQSRDGETPILYITKVHGTQTGNDGKVYPDGKFLKSLNFEEPRYKPVIKDRLAVKVNLDENDPNPQAILNAMMDKFKDKVFPQAELTHQLATELGRPKNFKEILLAKRIGLARTIALHRVSPDTDINTFFSVGMVQELINRHKEPDKVEKTGENQLTVHVTYPDTVGEFLKDWDALCDRDDFVREMTGPVPAGDWVDALVAQEEQAEREIVFGMDLEAKMASVDFPKLTRSLTLHLYNFIEQECLPKGIQELAVSVGPTCAMEIKLGEGQRILPTGLVSFIKIDINDESHRAIYDAVKDTLGNSRVMQEDFASMMDDLKKSYPNIFAKNDEVLVEDHF